MLSKAYKCCEETEAPFSELKFREGACVSSSPFEDAAFDVVGAVA